MRGKLAVAFLAGLVVGLVAVMVAGRAPQAQAQKQPPPVVVPQWEYWVLMVPSEANGATKYLNQLAEDRWEYVGLVSTSVYGGPRGRSHETLVAFRRPKK
jgi:hypothetical protein